MTRAGLSFLPYRVSVSDGAGKALYSFEALNEAHAACQGAQSFLGLEASPNERSRLTILVMPTTSNR